MIKYLAAKQERAPAMQAGIETRLWSMEDVAALVKARDAAPAKRGTYKPRRPKAAATISN